MFQVKNKKNYKLKRNRCFRNIGRGKIFIRFLEGRLENYYTTKILYFSFLETDFT